MTKIVLVPPTPEPTDEQKKDAEIITGAIKRAREEQRAALKAKKLMVVPQIDDDGSIFFEFVRGDVVEGRVTPDQSQAIGRHANEAYRNGNKDGMNRGFVLAARLCRDIAEAWQPSDTQLDGPSMALDLAKRIEAERYDESDVFATKMIEHAPAFLRSLSPLFSVVNANREKDSTTQLWKDPNGSAALTVGDIRAIFAMMETAGLFGEPDPEAPPEAPPESS